MSKPVVYFSKVRGFIDVAGEGIRARLSGVKGHPRLGDEDDVTTSIIVRVKYDDEVTKLVEFETLNTIYRKLEVTE